MTQDFARRTRERVAEARTALARLRDVSKETVKELAKLDKQHVTDRSRVYERLGQLGDDLVEKLPEAATEADVAHAYALQEQINDLASDIEEISLASYSIEDLDSTLGDAIREASARLKESEAQLAKLERLGAKLGV